MKKLTPAQLKAREGDSVQARYLRAKDEIIEFNLDQGDFKRAWDAHHLWCMREVIPRLDAEVQATAEGTPERQTAEYRRMNFQFVESPEFSEIMHWYAVLWRGSRLIGRILEDDESALPEATEALRQMNRAATAFIEKWKDAPSGSVEDASAPTPQVRVERDE